MHSGCGVSNSLFVFLSLCAGAISQVTVHAVSLIIGLIPGLLVLRGRPFERCQPPSRAS